MKRMSTCMACGVWFAIVPNHPAWESEYCVDCGRAIRERVLVEWDTARPVSGMRSEDV